MPVMKADAIKYIVTFRSVLPPQVIVSTLPALTKLLEAESVVVRIYAAAAIDKILLLKQPGTKTPVLVYFNKLITITYTNYFNKLNLSLEYKNPVKNCFVYI